MLKGVDLDKILDEDHGDAGYNDDVEEQPEGAAGNRPKAPTTPWKMPEKPPAPPEPFERRAVYGAAPPPPPGTDAETAELEVAWDELARERGYKDGHEFNQYLNTLQPEKEEKEDPQKEEPLLGPDLAPGIKTAPAYMPPGAYPGDKTRVDPDKKDNPERTKYKHVAGPAKPITDPKAPKPGAEEMATKYVKQNSSFHANGRPKDGNVIAFRTHEGGEEFEELLGSKELPWALEKAVANMKIGDVMDIVARDEHAFADNEEFVKGTERRWPYFELIDIWGDSKNKFNLSFEERLERADELRVRGNEMYKAGRLLRSLNYYERGSGLMDVLEVSTVGPMSKYHNKEAEERNKLIWECQKSLTLNWALLLMKFERWVEAERKCTEVLMDVDKLNVKALFRRGICHIHLGDQEQARTDLNRAAELDTSLREEVDRELIKVEAMQKKVDKEWLGDISKKVVKDLDGTKDTRSLLPPPKEVAPAITPQDRMLQELAMQAQACEDDSDDDAYCQQRQKIYNQFMMTPQLMED